ncbi:DUF397 domain-containing protein [Streptomyces roseoverticillatus]|uniref:DUF397 domain-containing protein n=1 Tax=Streptomyces roseoverticillatus TaxID=66429 RepID=UPI0004C016EE|nr:DUF397 domain-containing protein [Streptomyces roseoverticillatus]
MRFRKSSYSSVVEDCVEIALPEDLDPVLIRDSKRPGGPALRIAAAPYRSFAQAIRNRELGTT